MDKFSSALRGYDKGEVNKFIDDIIERVEGMVEEIAAKDRTIEHLEEIVKKNQIVSKKLSQEVESLNKKIELFMTSEDYDELSSAKETLDESRLLAQHIIEDARNKADAIIGECLLNIQKEEAELKSLQNKLKQMKETVYYDA